MRKILDKMFCNKKLCMLIPILIAMLVCLLFILFSNMDNKINSIIALPIISAFWYFGSFLVIYIQVKNTMCPEWFLNLFELMVTVGFGVYAISSMVQFIISGFQNLDYGLCLGLLTYSSVCWAHNKRTK